MDDVLQYVFDGESDFEEIDDENDRFGKFFCFSSLARCIIYATTEKLHCQQFLMKIIIELRITPKGIFRAF